MQHSPFFTTTADRVALARQRYFEDGLRPSGVISEPVIQSWQRCLAAGLRPHERPAFEPITRSRVSAALARSHAVLEAAAPEIEQLHQLLSGTSCRMVLTDHQGIVLRATPAPAGGGGLLDVATRTGVDLAEANLGSTAPGVSAASGQGCTVTGAEHFFGVLAQVHCAAAPIRNREGAVAAVLDLSVEGQPFAFDAYAVVRLFAAAIENRLVAAQAWDHLLLRFQFAPGLLGTPMEGLAIVDGRGRVSWVNPAGQALLQPPRTLSAPHDVESLFGLALPALQRLCAESSPQSHRLPSGLGIWLQVCEPARAGRAPERPAAPVSLGDIHRRHIEDTLTACRGNISAAARQLGVSRGLLYRRLQEWRSADRAARALTSP